MTVFIAVIDDSHIEDEKSFITTSTKKLVQAFRGLNSIKNTISSADPQSPQRTILLSAYKLLSDFNLNYVDYARYTDAQRKLLEDSKHITSLILQLMESDTISQPSILNDLVISVLAIDNGIQGSLDDEIVDKINKLLSSKRKTNVDIKIQLLECSNLVHRYSSYIQLDLCALAFNVQLPVYHYVTSEAVSNAVQLVKTMIKAFMDYELLANKLREQFV